MSELPEGWTTAILKDLVGLDGVLTDGDWILSEHLKTGNDVRLIQLADVGAGRFLDKSHKFISQKTANEIGVTYLRKDDVLISRMAHPLARACLLPDLNQPCITAVDVAIARCDETTSLPRFIMHLCNTHYVLNQAEAVAVGTTRKRISRKKLEQISVPLPPLNEQRRIVAKLEKLLSRVDAAQARLAAIPHILKRFRQSVLAAACSGRLTADWREKNSNSEDWKSVELMDMSERIQIGPFGTQVHKSDYLSNGIPLVNPTHIQDNRIDHDPAFSVSNAKRKELENYVLQENDIIIGRRGEMGRCALVSRKEAGWLCGTGSLFVRPKSGVDPPFLFLILRNGETKAFLENESKGTTMSNLNLGILERVPVSYPTLAEQHEIVRRVEALFKTANTLEARYLKAKAQVDKLTQSILARAFCGELVSQDPNDEPASALLERIRCERSVEPKKNQRRSHSSIPK